MIVQLDKSITFQEQLLLDEKSVVLINVFHVPEGKMEEVLDVWEEDAAYMKRQPGFISTQMHQGIGGSQTLVNYAVWESAKALGDAFFAEEFQTCRAKYPDGVTTSPHVFNTRAVPNICIGKL